VGVEVSETVQYAFNSIERTSTAERIVENLITLVKDRRLKTGDKLPSERQLCEMIGVSRPILREALKALQVMNIIDIRQGAGAYIKSLEPGDVVEHLDIVFHLDSSLYHDLYEARRLLEAGIAAMAAEKIGDSELALIEENIRRAASDIDNEQAFFERDLELHEMIMKAAGNRVIPVFMQSINKLALLIRQKTNAISNIRKNTIKDHGAILAALKNHDGRESAKAMERHIRNVERAFLNETEVEQ
jgi:GntR family transcriptional repressor for pyruvate dehydrogenase complex